MNKKIDKKIIKIISESTIYDFNKLYEILGRVKSYDKLFCIINMSMKFYIDLESAEEYICSWMNERFK
jgi:hypothetical protein